MGKTYKHTYGPVTVELDDPSGIFTLSHRDGTTVKLHSMSEQPNKATFADLCWLFQQVSEP